ncbi:MAG: hypothetical protein PVI59_14535 [Anaerolineae bacterium]|jgi:hypothetical protein
MTPRKIVILLSLSVTVVVATLLPIAILESRRTPDWQSSVNQYLEVSDIPLMSIHFMWVAEAQHVDRFPTDALVAVPTEWMWQSIDHIPPPERVRCIRFETRGGWKSARQAAAEHLVVGYHDDKLYHAGWIVHTFRPGVSPGEREELFTEMGCDHWERTSPGATW